MAPLSSQLRASALPKPRRSVQSGISRAAESILYIQIQMRIYCGGMAHMSMKAKKSHDLPLQDGSQGKQQCSFSPNLKA
jgi:hypothetical protein